MKNKIFIIFIIITLLVTGCAKQDSLDINTPQNQTQQDTNKQTDVKDETENIPKVVEPENPLEANDLYEYLSSVGIELPSSFVDGQEIVKTKDLRKLICEWIESYENSNLNTNGFSDKYIDNLDNNDLKLANSEIISLNGYAFEDVPLDAALQITLNLRAYFDGAIYGNYNEISTGADLVRYYKVLYPYYMKYGKKVNNLVSPENLLSFLGVTESSEIDRKIFSKFVVTLIESVNDRELNLDEYNPEHELYDGDDDNLKKLHMINFYPISRSLFIHPEYKLNKYELRTDLNRLLDFTRVFTGKDFERVYVDSEEMMSLLNDIYLENMGKVLVDKKEFTAENTRDYSFYVTQMDNSQYSTINCVPASTAMVTKWYDESLNFTSKQVRDSYPKDGNEWSMNDAMVWFDNHNIPYEKKTNDINILKNELDNGAIVELVIDNGKTFHSIVVVGYKQIGEDRYFMVYDPADEQSYQGKDIDYKYIYQSRLTYMMDQTRYTMIIVKK